MKGGKRTAKGRIINIDDVIAAAPHATAVGNMGVNAQGDKLGTGGKVVQTREKRTRAYYKNHPQSSNRQVSLKGDMTEAFEHGHTDLGGLAPDTAKTAYENVRTADTDLRSDVVDQTSNLAQENGEYDTDGHNPLVKGDIPEPEEFNHTNLDDSSDYETEPTGFREVELDNGDIEMQPYWDDQDEDKDTGSKLA
jgi:hypothetical protein